MTRSRGIRDTLKDVAARLRSSHAGERAAAKDRLLYLCKKHDIDPEEFGVSRPSIRVERQANEELNPYYKRQVERHEWLAAQFETNLGEAPDQAFARYLVRLARFAAARNLACAKGLTIRAPDGDMSGCAPMIEGFEDIEHTHYCRSPICPHPFVDNYPHDNALRDSGEAT